MNKIEELNMTLTEKSSTFFPFSFKQSKLDDDDAETIRLGRTLLNMQGKHYGMMKE